MELSMMAGSHTIRRDVLGAYSYLARNGPRVHVGLGGETPAHDLTRRSPDGTQERFGDAGADTVGVVRRGAGRAFQEA